MNEKVRKYVDSLFSDIPDSKQLRELKEEVCANLVERISDSLAQGTSGDDAFTQAIAELGDVSELAESMRKVSNTRFEESIFSQQPLDRKHVIGYVAASAIILFGILVAGVVQLKSGQLFQTVATLLPFVIVSAALFVYFGVTQESAYSYGMSHKRALAYSLATAVCLFGLMTAGILYYQGQPYYVVLATFIPFVLPSAVAFIYLGLTEKSRLKVDQEWTREWMEKWTEEWKHNFHNENHMVRGGVSGALWIFSVAIFLIIGFSGGWKYAWIVFVFATGIEALLSAVFAHKYRK